MKSKALYIAITVLVVAAGAAFAFKRNKQNSSGQQQTQNQSQNQNNSNQSNTGTPNQIAVGEPTGCPSGQEINSVDSKGRFKPTVDIANKQAVIDTNFGKITIQLYDKDAPKTVENFVCLIQKDYYKGVTFHRVAHNFVIQGGDPTGTGSGGESVYGKSFEDELYSDTPSYQAGYKKGVVAMANSGPNTNGSQFFIMLADQPLPHNYTIFGKVISGQDVVDKIGALSVSPVFGPDDGKPTQQVVINSATIVSAK